jgi:predicted Rossmann fold flavoprotein
MTTIVFLCYDNKINMKHDVIIIGAGAAGLMCAIEAGKRGRKVALLDHAKSVGEKIRISGGGRCNFTNIHAAPENYLSSNPRFCISALKRFTQNDFLKLVRKHKIAYHEKTLGQLFCDDSSKQIIDMLLSECKAANVQIKLNSKITNIEKQGDIFKVATNAGEMTASSVVVATGGLSIPKLGATSFGYDLAKKFGLKVIAPQAALVPFTLDEETLRNLKPLSGVSVDCTVSCNGQTFKEAMLFTHRGLSGPAILQISSYWKPGDKITLNLTPDHDIMQLLKDFRQSNPKQEVVTSLGNILPKRLAQYICSENNFTGRLADLSNKSLQQISDAICKWTLIPNGTEGYRTAEVTIGGVDTDELSSKTFECKNVPGLYFIGEIVDVTGHLGGFNFQWAWSSAYAAGQFV